MTDSSSQPKKFLERRRERWLECTLEVQGNDDNHCPGVKTNLYQLEFQEKSEMPLV